MNPVGKIIVYNVVCNKRNLKQYLRKISYRWYELEDELMVTLQTSRGTFRYFIKKGFRFDSRSGGFGIDWILPHLGSDKDILTWLLHDIHAYGLYFDFETTNEIMRQMIIDAGHYSWQAGAGKWGVGLSKSWFGMPKPKDREYCNVHPELKFFRAEIHV